MLSAGFPNVLRIGGECVVVFDSSGDKVHIHPETLHVAVAGDDAVDDCRHVVHLCFEIHVWNTQIPNRCVF